MPSTIRAGRAPNIVTSGSCAHNLVPWRKLISDPSGYIALDLGWTVALGYLRPGNFCGFHPWLYLREFWRCRNTSETEIFHYISASLLRHIHNRRDRER